jgi:ribosome-associated protein
MDLAWDGESSEVRISGKHKMHPMADFFAFGSSSLRRMCYAARPPRQACEPVEAEIDVMSEQVKGMELAVACAKAADEMQAENIQVWDVRGQSTITDFVVICSGSSMPHLRAIMRDVAGHVMEWHQVKPILSEGNADSRWVVLDYIDVMVHVLHTEMREYYDLESMWAKAKPIEWQSPQ